MSDAHVRRRRGRRAQSPQAPAVAGLVLALCIGTAWGVRAGVSGASPAPPAPAAGQPALRGRIAFQSRVDGRWQIFVLDLPERTRRRIGFSSADDTYPVFSPQGDWIAFESNRGGSQGIYRMRAEGGEPELLTAGPGPCSSPAWHPGGTKLAYDCVRDGHEELFALDLGARRETPLTGSVWRSALPHWSPDGSAIAFARSRLGWDVYRMRADGSGIERLTRRGGNCRPDWSPDGSRIAYVSDVADGKGDIWTMAADGSAPTRLTRDSGSYDYDPAWSPDGAWIVYQAAADKVRGPWALYVIPAAGGEPVRISPVGAEDRFPDWAW